MKFYLEIISGPTTKGHFQLLPGRRIGRGACEIHLDDPKVSGLHARIELDLKGNFVVIDQNSANGIKVNGLRVKRLALAPGVIFKLGGTILKVVGDLEHVIEENTPSIIEAPPPDPLQALRSQIVKLPLKNKVLERGVRPFSSCVQLRFLEGPQAEELLTLGYGPRKAGSNPFDIELFEESAPPLAFEIVPDPSGALFVTTFPTLVRINNLSCESKLLQEGDTIRIGKTLIRVEFL